MSLCDLFYVSFCQKKFFFKKENTIIYFLSQLYNNVVFRPYKKDNKNWRDRITVMTTINNGNGDNYSNGGCDGNKSDHNSSISNGFCCSKGADNSSLLCCSNIDKKNSLTDPDVVNINDLI